MIKAYFTVIKRLLLFFVKCAALLFVALMILVQIPELRYDFGASKPLTISSPEELNDAHIVRSTFSSVEGTPNFDLAFVYKRYGMSYTYFTLEPYGVKLILRTYDTVTDEWKNIDRFLGKLRPFDDQPFSYSIRKIFKDKNQIDIPENSYFLGLRDVPKPSGWQVGAIVFASILWLVMFYMFFFFGRKHSSAADGI
ncbi:hypothetical protein ACFL47_04965 [Candidatus Latescibacterota bacterium]